MLLKLPLAARLLKAGELVAFPTETVYGLGASVFLPEAIDKIFVVKGRPQDNPLIVHISDLKQLATITCNIPDSFYLLAECFFPGPLTVLLPKHHSVPDSVSAHLPTIGVRMPAHQLALQLIESVGTPLVAPSANLSGKPSSTTAQHVLDDFKDQIAGVIDGGACTLGIESTVITLTPHPMILRPGSIAKEQLEKVLKCSISMAPESVDKPLSPGMKYKHYAPCAKVVMVQDEEALEQMPKRNRVILKQIKPSDLYALFRSADAEQKEEIVIICDEEMQKNGALMNRIMRACS